MADTRFPAAMRWGMGLVAAGWLVEVIFYLSPGWRWPLQIETGVIVCGLGLMLAALARGRSLIWGAWTLVPVLGPLAALPTLCLLRPDEAERSESIPARLKFAVVLVLAASSCSVYL